MEALSPEQSALLAWLTKVGLDEVSAEQTVGRLAADGYMSVQDVKRLAGSAEKSAESARLPKYFMKLAHMDKVKAASQDGALEQQILQDLVDPSAGVAWDDVAGLAFAKRSLWEALVLPRLQPQLFDSLLRSPPQGVLLFGPPGTGKTLLAEAVAGATEGTFFSISASSINSRWFGESEKLVRALFSVARREEHAVIFIDEVDSMLSARSGGEDDAGRRVKTEFMVQLSGLKGRASEGQLLVIAATNRPWDLDPAALRRFAKRIYVPLPGADARREMLLRLLHQDSSMGLSDAELATLVQRTDGYSCSDLFELCREASSERLRSLRLWERDRSTVTLDEVAPISAAHFDTALNVIRSSVPGSSLATYQAWDEQFGSAGEARRQAAVALEPAELPASVPQPPQSKL